MTGTERTDALALVALYDERIALTKAMAEHPRPTGVMADRALAKARELEAACEAFRRRYYPRRHRVIVGLGIVMTVSRSGRSITTVLA